MIEILDAILKTIIQDPGFALAVLALSLSGVLLFDDYSGKQDRP